jgi:radical SAM superfamily enzyme YgiQ (UPF0313 family)
MLNDLAAGNGHMKVLLIQPPIQDFYQTEIRLQPIGLAYLKAAAKKHLPDVQVVVKDFHQGFSRQSIPLPGELAYLRPYYPGIDTSPFSSFFHYYHFGAGFDEIAHAVACERPDFIGISALFSPYHREVLRTAHAIRERWHAPIIVGGSHASAAPETLMSCPDIDFIVRGEGERPFVELIRALRKEQSVCRVPNLGYREAGKWRWNPAQDNYVLEDIPAPDFSDFETARYCYNRRPMTFLVTSRGCPHRCSFCAVHLTFGRHYRQRTAGNILAEIQQRYREGIRVFDFEDDNLTCFLPQMKDLCRQLIDAFAPGELQLLAMNGISYHSLDAELLRLMRQAGFTHLNISLVSSNDSVRQALHRPHTRQHYLDMVDTAVDLGFHVVSYQILGLPGESVESQIETLSLNVQLPVLLGASIFYLTPGTPISGQLPVMTELDMFRSRSTAMAFPTADCSRDVLYTLFVSSRILNFLKGLHPPDQESRLEDALTSASQSGSRNALGAGILTKLLRDGALIAVNGAAQIPLQKFDPQLFRRILNRAGRLVTLERKVIHLGPLPEC